ncbi:MAG: hypothetical protein J0M20_08850 [Burkholderiales bacterium]|nr:hypothetical protein [Burkholderiales bacterium]
MVDARHAEHRFHSRAARHFFCRVSGIQPFHRKRVAPGVLVVNVHGQEDIALGGVPVRRAAGAAMS